jgi:hypothetical protein
MFHEVHKSKSQYTVSISVDQGQNGIICENGICHETRGVLHYGLAICTIKYLKSERKIMETQIFQHAKV